MGEKSQYHQLLAIYNRKEPFVANSPLACEFRFRNLIAYYMDPEDEYERWFTKEVNQN